MRTSQSGFTMLEILVVIGLVLMLSTMALLVSFDTYRGSNFRNDRDLLVATLERARAQSLNNLCVGTTCTAAQNSRPHGVAIRPNGQPNSYVVFQGASYVTRDSGVDSNFVASQTSTTTGATEIVFSPLSGTTTAKTVTVSDTSGHSSVITIGTDGQIIWTH
jgi:prepilin-type N-terminal cleavage/methylation domain-containing protein